VTAWPVRAEASPQAAAAAAATISRTDPAGGSAAKLRTAHRREHCEAAGPLEAIISAEGNSGH